MLPTNRHTHTHRHEERVGTYNWAQDMANTTPFAFVIKLSTYFMRKHSVHVRYIFALPHNQLYSNKKRVSARGHGMKTARKSNNIFRRCFLVGRNIQHDKEFYLQIRHSDAFSFSWFWCSSFLFLIILYPPPMLPPPSPLQPPPTLSLSSSSSCICRRKQFIESYTKDTRQHNTYAYVGGKKRFNSKA